MKPATSYHNMERKPLTERSAQGRTQQPRRRMVGSHKRTYGKGGTASSQAVLDDPFLDENEIEEQMFKISLGQEVAPLSSGDVAKPIPLADAVPVTQKGREVQNIPAVSQEAVAYTSPLLAECLKPKGLCDFSAWAERVSGAFKVMKVAEGSYGEVFKLEKRDIPLRRAAKATKQDPDAYGGCIFKLIPLRAKSSKSNKQTSLDALVREVQMLKRMDPIPGFARFRDITVLEGPYPLSFTEAYNDHRALRPSDSHNTLPSRYPQKQLWAMIEMDDGGRDLEILRTPSAYQIFDIFWTTCCALSYAEEHVEFEHRDLHMGNICIKPTHPNHALDISPTLNTTMQPHDLRPSNFGYSGLRTTIIDYTLSRATSSSSDNTNNNHPAILYDPMKTLSIFSQTGKTPEQTSQFSTYRKMRAHALESDAQSRNEDPSRENKKRDKWERFLPRTNVLWLECLLFTLLYRSKERVLVGSSEAAGEVQEGIYKGLKRMMGVLDGGDSGEREEGPGSARQVIEVAHGEGLLTDQDLVAIKESLE